MARRNLTVLFIVLCASLPAGAQDKKSEQWIVVTAPAFRDALTPLCDHRRAEGMEVHLVQTTDVLNAKQIRAGDADLLKEHVHKFCRQNKGPNYVLLVGALKGADSEIMPPLHGTAGRMKGKLTDFLYACPDKAITPPVAVGRFPATTEEDVRQMVRKTLAFECDRSPSPCRHRLTLLVGNPGGSSAVEKGFAEMLVNSFAGVRFKRLNPTWTTRALIHSSGSPFSVPDDRLTSVALDYLQAGQVFTFFLGHSNATGLFSDGLVFLERDVWANQKTMNGRGVLFSCGCFGCQWEGVGGEGYGVSAMHNPHGPVAVIGAHGESYAALGQLAFDGMLECLSKAETPERLADYWLAVQAGIARGKIDPLTFWLLDQADGSRGKVTLAAQRLEHLEMWVLLGDPALKLPIRCPSISLTAKGTATAGKPIVCNGVLPAQFAGSKVRVTLERPAGSLPVRLEALPRDPAKKSGVMLVNHQRANDVVLSSCEVQPKNGRFEATLTLPAELPWTQLTLRAVAVTETEMAQGVLKILLGS